MANEAKIRWSMVVAACSANEAKIRAWLCCGVRAVGVLLVVHCVSWLLGWSFVLVEVAPGCNINFQRHCDR